MNRLELQNALEADIKFANPNDNQATIYARMLGVLLAHTKAETLEHILELRKQECARCGQDVLPSQHAEIGCDI